MDIEKPYYKLNQRKQNILPTFRNNGDTVKQLSKKPYLLYKSRAKWFVNPEKR
jgi:hypothetical protein